MKLIGVIIEVKLIDMCDRPLTAFYTGSRTPNGKPDYVIGKRGDKVFSCALAEKYGHFIGADADVEVIDNKPYLVNPVPIPCGHCIQCRMNRAAEWKARCCIEASFNPVNWFVTLTYAPQFVPHNSEGELILVKKHLQLFFKRLRKRGIKFRYFACGEYGSEENTARPHYHCIIFGNPFPDAELLARNVYESEILQSCWPFGQVMLNVADSGCIAYVCGYVEKKQLIDLRSYSVKPFLLMSRKPAIGFSVDAACKKSGKLYGDFGSRCYIGLPRIYLRKFEAIDKDFVDSYKEIKAAAGKDMLFAKRSACASESEYFYQERNERALKKRLEKVRNEVL